MKYSFKNDYSEGCHPKILEALLKTNLEVQNGYGLDDYCRNAEKMIQDLCESPSSKVYFVSGGTQANLIVLSSFLRPHESVVAADSGHIFTNEAGAIEATGHKVHSIESEDGKIYPHQIQNILDSHTNIPHQLKQRLVYISNSTEVGTIYSKDELQQLSDYCKNTNLLFFLDGARLGHALTSDVSDVTMKDIAKLTDAFYLGGTKNGALIGEAIVINNPELQKDFEFNIKQKGAMLAKGRLLGIQFQELLRDNLYFELAKKANEDAMTIKKAFRENGFEFLAETFTNQIFPILNYVEIEQLSKDFDFYVWKKIDDEKAAIRLITSWATTKEAIEKIVQQIALLR